MKAKCFGAQCSKCGQGLFFWGGIRVADSSRNDKQGKLEADPDVVACWPGVISYHLNQTFESLVYGW